TAVRACALRASAKNAACMTREGIYGWLLHLYPAAFRREYGNEMRQTFAALAADDGRSPLRFWLSILLDVLRSVVREHLDVATGGERRLALRWMSACVLGTLASGATILTFIVIVNVLVPPHVDSQGVFQNTARNLPIGIYGALI